MFALYNTELDTYFFFGSKEKCESELKKLQVESEEQMIDCSVEIREVDLKDEYINEYYQKFLNGEDII